MEILDRQNEIKSLEVQTTARLLYNRADTIDMIQWIVVLLLPILKIFFLQSIFLNYLMIIWFFASFVLDYYIDKYTDTAAELKKVLIIMCMDGLMVFKKNFFIYLKHTKLGTGNFLKHKLVILELINLKALKIGIQL